MFGKILAVSILSLLALLAVVIVIGATIYSPAPPQRDDPFAVHLQHLQGTWIADELKVGSHPSTRLNGDQRLVIVGNEFRCYQGEKLISAGAVTLLSTVDGTPENRFVLAVETRACRLPGRLDIVGSQHTMSTYWGDWLYRLASRGLDYDCFWLDDPAPRAERVRNFGVVSGLGDRAVSVRWTRYGVTRPHL
jgi:hypothetical protein